MLKFVVMPKEIKERKETKKGLTNAELIAKYGNDTPTIPFDAMIKTMLSKPASNAPIKIAKSI